MSSSPPAREPGDRQQPLMWELTVFKSRAALGKVRVNRYLRANMVNLMYAVIMIVMDVAVYSNEFEGLAYLTLAVIHCVNAYMYLW